MNGPLPLAERVESALDEDFVDDEVAGARSLLAAPRGLHDVVRAAKIYLQMNSVGALPARVGGRPDARGGGPGRGVKKRNGPF